MKSNIFPALKLTLLCIILFVGVYSGVIWTLAQWIAPNHGKGEVILKGNQIIGFTMIGQSFTKDTYFWSRPSAVKYNAAGSGGSNKGPSNPEYLLTIQARIDTFLIHNPGISRSQVPADMVTASGSGLDPHISLAAALVQAPRIARRRGITVKIVKELIQQHAEEPWLGLFGPSRINVLKLNLALDAI
jgi:K+-transporting ATPase ATPase C chain